MCGIFGYSGQGSASETILQGLKRLEYRGYDSWGIAIKTDKSIKRIRKVGKIGDISANLGMEASHLGIGHTRWATHGGVTQKNAHPHFSKDRKFAVAQNGIVENFQELKTALKKKGHAFVTQTDTEVIVRLIEEKLKKEKDLRRAVRAAFLELEGRNTLLVLNSQEQQIIAVRNGSPLVIGLGQNEVFFSSDTMPFADKTKRVVFMNDMEMAEILDGKVSVFSVATDKVLIPKVSQLDQDFMKVDTGGFDHFMIKEIFDQVHSLREITNTSLDDFQPLVKAIQKAGRVYTVGAGSASYVAGQIAGYLREYASIQATELKAYEVSSYVRNFKRGDVLIAVSQSGETADTIAAIQSAQKEGVLVASIVNMVGSTIPRISDFSFYTRSGPEIAVASTKALTAQMLWGFLLSQALIGKYDSAVGEGKKLSLALHKEFFSQKNFIQQYQKICKKLRRHQHAFVLGRGQNYYAALEGALKLKEIAYLHTEGFGAGELKHGMIALIEKGTPVFLLVSPDEHQKDVLSAAAEVKARGAWTIGVGCENNELFDDFLFVPESQHLDALSMVIPFQTLAYYLGVALGYDPDKPRNLAKSVTVR